MESSSQPGVPRFPADLPQELRDAYDAATDDAGRAAALHSMVRFVEGRSRWDAVELAEAALDAAMRTDDQELIIRTTLLTAFQLNENGRADEAFRHVVEALAMATTIRDVNPDPYLRAVSTRAVIRATVGDESAARRDYEQVIDAATNPITKMVARINLTSLLVEMDNPRRALFHEIVARQDVEEIRAAGDLTAVQYRYFMTSLDLLRAGAQCLEAQRLLRRGLPNEVPPLLDSALSTLDALLASGECGKYNELSCRTWLAAICRLSGDLDRAEDEARRAVALAHELGQHISPHSWVELAMVLDEREQTSEARRMWHEAIAVAERLNSSMLLIRLLPRFADHYERCGDLTAALETTRRALQRAMHVSSSISELNDIAMVADDLIESGGSSLSWRDRFYLVEQQAKLDPLTGLLNRRGMLAAIQNAPTSPDEHRGQQVIALLDIDHFKLINDTYSHHIGDTVLRTVGRLMVDSVPRDVHVGRHGGEEFSMVFHVEQLSTAGAMLERVRAAISEFDWSTVAPGLEVRISGGYAGWSPGTTTSEALNAADRLLYDAKRQGRDRIVGPD